MWPGIQSSLTKENSYPVKQYIDDVFVRDTINNIILTSINWNQNLLNTKEVDVVIGHSGVSITLCHANKHESGNWDYSDEL